MIPLIGYTDKLSARPGDRVTVKVSSTAKDPYSARLVRVISGDPNPAGPGMVFEPIDAAFAGDYPSRAQETHLGSHMTASLSDSLPSQITLRANIWPTTPDKQGQAVITLVDEDGAPTLTLGIGPNGVEARAGETIVATGTLLHRWRWHAIFATYDQDSETLSVGVRRLDVEGDVAAASVDGIEANLEDVTSILVAAEKSDDPETHYNGKIEAPALLGGSDILAHWDFSENMSSLTVLSTGPLASDGTLVGGPARAMTGSNWDASEMNWQNAPEQYGAIHFHDDDIADAGWDTDFEFDVPVGLKSGVYAVHLSCGDHWDYLPLFVPPPHGKKTAKVCLVMSTFTWVIYANQARGDFGQHWRDRAAEWGSMPYNPVDHPAFGLSCYNEHSDGSGICHTTWLRPMLNVRPGYHPFADEKCGSGLRHFPADTHLLAWLENKGIAFDIVTDWELHHEGADLLAAYDCVLTGSHPEYHTLESLDAFQGYSDRGGNLIYLGGNGFYWRIALHPELDGLMELRRAEGGLRAWEAQPGEYYHAFTGEYGGLWRRNGRPPQRLAGVGYTCQGDFEGTYYRRTDASRSEEIAWMFEGIEEDILGDFGFGGGGAAGYELDRADIRLGTPEDAVIVASSENHPESFVMPPEEWLTHVKTVAGPTPEEIIRADMVYFETPSGGRVFSTGSITFCGSLPWNNFDNNISILLENVVKRFSA